MKEMRIVFIHRRKFQERPPVISSVIHLVSLGVTPYVITTGLNEKFRCYFKENGIDHTVIPFSITNSFVKNIIKGFIWGIRARRKIKQLSKKEKIVLWVEGNYTFDSLSSRFINKYPHILQNQELFEYSFKGRYTTHTLKSIMPSALANIVPEYNRAYIYYALIGLKKLPLIMPNKPAFLPNREELSILGEKYVDVLDRINGRKVLLYQGILSKERNLENYVKASTRLDPQQYVLMLVGRKTKFVEQYLQINPSLIYVDFIPAPDYLFFTSLAYIGIVTYSPQSLNTVYCAPNKLFEYGAFNVPMLGSDIPGLRYTIASNECGQVCDESSVDSILNAISKIEGNYEEMSKRSREYYDMTNNKETVREVLRIIDAHN